MHIKSSHSCHCILINFIGYVNSHHPYHTCLWRSKLHENVSLPGNVIARQIHFHEQGFPSQLETLGSLKGIYIIMYIQKCLISDIDPWFVCLKRCRSGVDIEKKNPLQQRELTYKHTYPETTPRCRGFSSCAFFLQQVS